MARQSRFQRSYQSGASCFSPVEAQVLDKKGVDLPCREPIAAKLSKGERAGADTIGCQSSRVFPAVAAGAREHEARRGIACDLTPVPSAA